MPRTIYLPAPFDTWTGAPNLDAETPDTLMAFWDVGRRSVKLARQLFPGIRRGHVQATQLLACYASNKATAMSCRLRGDINAATCYETICDQVYDRLPEFARW